ncbi:HNH endonuclease [Urbifossiella limnaea]|uniref:HNH endonuclease n=1 Tax=Urbifossiella limnaea TaxID=2528023 RepID=A0A517XNQ7_9BACT|nr:HNH endonuclease [Urbifossiella limnaea]QDU19122.1 HNH endonuclease [Urbifossiella limnaea]
MNPLAAAPGIPTALDASVLVLNKTFMAVHVISVRRAFCLLCKDLAEVVSLEEGAFATYTFQSWAELSELRSKLNVQSDDDWVRTPTAALQAPRVIRLLGYDRMPKQTVKFNRRNIFARDHNQCQYCGKKFPTSELSLDHVSPRSQGGGTTWDNIVCACVDCNVRKGGRTPRQANMTLIRKPEKPKRSPLLNLKLTQKKYQSWASFVDAAYWSVELKG